MLVIVAPEDGDLLADVPAERARRFPDLDGATEWCEERLLAAHGGAAVAEQRIALAEHRFADGLDAAMLARFEQVLEPRPFAVGEMLFSAGEPATEVFLLLAGEVTVEVELEGRRRRLATLTPGLAFGEAALAEVEPRRPVSVRGERAGECLVLSLTAFERLAETDPGLQVALMRNILASFYETIGRSAREAGPR